MKYFLPYIAPEQNGIVGFNPEDEQDERIRQYRTYFDSIKAQLPPDLLLFGDRGNGTVSLNDCEVRAIESDFEARSVDIVMSGFSYDVVSGRNVDRRFTLSYRDVTRFRYKGKETGLAGLDGDHLFDEIELLGPGLFEHRMLFSGEIEIAVMFGDFSLSYVDNAPERSLREERQKDV